MSTVIDTLVTDRARFTPYNVADLNRVGQAVSYVNTRLSAAGYNITVTAKQDWAATDIPTVEQMTAYLADITLMRGAIAVLSTTPSVPGDMVALASQEANDIEQILADCDQMITNMRAAYVYSGTITSGGGGIYGR